ncbi:MAG: restriction endonuclease subunit S [Burkholderiales bacterium]|jgi:type I restriction enzyme S subunit|nr:restriction endonuclease subunit S [Burkholderiales bacterium]
MMWPEVSIANFCQTGSGGTPSRSNTNYYGGTIPWIKSGELRDEPLRATEEFITEQALKDSSAKIVPAGAILIAMYGATVGRTALLEFEATTNQAVCFVIPDSRIAIGRYVWYAMRANYESLLSKRVGGAQPNISQQIIKNVRLPIPSLSEQSRIVELLDEADRLRKLSCELDDKVSRILPALFLKMFGDPATNPMGWAPKRLGELADDKPEYGANASACAASEGKPRYVRITDIRENGVLSDKGVVSLDLEDYGRYMLAEGDVLFARSGNTVGKTYIYRLDDGACAYAGYLIRFRFRLGGTDPWFIFGLTRTAYYRGWVESHKRVAGQPNINGQEYAGLLVPEPPLALQQRFGALARSMESIVSQASRANENLEALFDTLLQRAFSGQLTAKWREAHMKELLTEMEDQARVLNIPLPKELEATA